MKKLTFIFLLLIASIGMAATPEDNFNLAQEYFSKSDYAKAKSYYQKLNDNDEYSARIYENYRICLIKLKEFKTVDKYLKKKLKSDPTNAQLIVDKALNQQMMGNEKSYLSLIKKEEEYRKKNLLALRELVKALRSRDLIDEAIQVMNNAKSTFHDEALFSYDLADIYLRKGNTKVFITHILVYVKEEPNQLLYVENLFQSVLKLKDYDELEIQLFPLLTDKSTQVYSELITWMYIQKKDFYNAYVQLRAIDKVTYDRGKRLLELGALALDNVDYENAITIFSYVQENYPSDYNGYVAEKLKIGAKRQKIESTYPIDTALIQSIVVDYKELLTRTRRVDDQIDIKRQMARMEAFYLAKYNESIANLKSLINNPRISLVLKSECKLELGDIYILVNEPWESALLYYQVEKDFETETIGHEAKLRNSKLSYYKGDFELAQSHLDILKEATSREISNDAMALSLLIKDNLALDTSDAALKLYAFAELYEFQGNINKSISYLNSLIKTFEGHSLIDECYFKKGQILLSKGQYEAALQNFKIVVSDFPDDILADAALYNLAITYEIYLKNTELAKATYKRILIDYSGSVYAVDARKRYRLLRGDKI